MCYSAQIRTDYSKFARVFGAILGVDEFVRLTGIVSKEARPRSLRP